MALAILLAIPATYALLRTYDVLFRHEPNPATVVWSVHIAMFWRLAIGAYAAGMVAPLVFVAARRNFEGTLKVLYVLVFVVASIAALQGLFLP